MVLIIVTFGLNEMVLFEHPSSPLFSHKYNDYLYFFHSCASCSYDLKYFCNVELMALYAILAGNDITPFNATPI